MRLIKYGEIFHCGKIFQNMIHLLAACLFHVAGLQLN